MNTFHKNSAWARPAQRGSAVLMLIVLLGLMVMLVAANTVTLNGLRQEVRLVEKRQTDRLAVSATNSPPPATANIQ